MMNEETRRKLRELSMEEMIAALDIQAADTRYLLFRTLRAVINRRHQSKSHQ